MRKYWIVYGGNFRNVYSLFYTENKEDEAKLFPGAERITREEALRKCREEKDRRKYNPMFAGYGAIEIYPADTSIPCVKRGYIWERW